MYTRLSYQVPLNQSPPYKANCSSPLATVPGTPAEEQEASVESLSTGSEDRNAAIPL